MNHRITIELNSVDAESEVQITITTDGEAEDYVPASHQFFHRWMVPAFALASEVEPMFKVEKE